ncbi:MAG: alpha/beta fold hydrolase, partial [Mycobacteriales bacterium]
MSAEATWFGSPDRPLAGWLHVPDDGRARGAVVICPPLGLEYIPSHRALRLVAERLAARGFVALRLDYDGTGDSAGGPDDPDRAAALLASIRHAVLEVRSVAAGAPVALVGLRMGATLAAAWSATADASDLPVSALVMWDACRSGRAFLRQERSLGLLVGGRDAGDGSIDAPGFHYTADTVRGLSQIGVGLDAVAVPHVLVLARTENDGAAVLPAMAGVTRDVVHNMSEMLDVPSPSSLVATAGIERLVGWLDAVLPADVVPARAGGRVEAAVGTGVIERHLRVGPLGLSGVETCPATGGPARRAVLLLNNAAEGHVGPVRLWTELARAWASQGVRSILFDLSGIGDSPTRPGAADDLIYAPFDEGDVRAVIASGIVGDDPVIVGLCSGAHLALRVGPSTPSSSVVAVNIATTLPIEPRPVGPGFDLEIPRGWPRRMLRAVGVSAAGRGLMRRVE